VGSDVSREKLPRAEKDLYSRHSERIVRALELRQLDFLSYGVLSFLVDKIAAPGRNGEALYMLKELARALGWPFEIEALRRRLHGLRDAGWITFENPRRGPEAPWIFRLSGAEVDGERDESLVSFHQSFLAGRPVREETVSAQAERVEAANPQSEEGSEPSEFPRRARAEQSRAESETENRCSEETKLDHVGDKTTATDPRVTYRLLAKVDGTEHQREEAPPVQIEHGDNGSLVWNGEALKGEAGVLADCDALVNAGLGEWIESDGARLSDDELTELGSLPLDVLHRRNERGEL
jgi:hypothetical protein